MYLKLPKKLVQVSLTILNMIILASLHILFALT